MRITNRRERKGAAAVEFAFVLLPVMGIVVGTIESGRLMSVQEMMVNAVREGARLSALGGSTMGTSTSSGAYEVNNRVREYLNAAGIPTTSATITVTDLDQPAITDLPQASPGDRIQVSVSLPYSSVAWGTSWFFSNATLSATSVMRKEAP
jgi:Flp pilus assembly protein TadG